MRSHSASSRLTAGALALGASTLMFTACGSPTPRTPLAVPTAAATPSPTATDTPSETSFEPVPDNEVSTGRIDAGSAIDTALQAVPGAVVELELGRERATIVWEVGVLGADGSGTEIYLDAQSGTVLRQGRLVLDAAQRTAPTITARQALDTARQTVEGTVKSMDLDTERGVVVWEVVVIGARGGTELSIDATTGAVVRQQRA